MLSAIFLSQLNSNETIEQISSNFSGANQISIVRKCYIGECISTRSVVLRFCNANIHSKASRQARDSCSRALRARCAKFWPKRTELNVKHVDVCVRLAVGWRCVARQSFCRVRSPVYLSRARSLALSLSRCLDNSRVENREAFIA